MGAINAALTQIDDVASEGDLAAEPPHGVGFELEAPVEPIELPDGKRIYPPLLHGEPIDEIARALLDMDHPGRSAFLRLIGPPGAGKSQIARAIAYRLWTGRGRRVGQRHGAPFYGFVEMQPGPSSDEYFFRHEWVPTAGGDGHVTLVDSAFVEAMREGWVVMIDEVNTARDQCLLSINATLDGRLSLYLAATGETVTAQPGIAVLLAYNPGLVDATDIPDAWHSRFPATLERWVQPAMKPWWQPRISSRAAGIQLGEAYPAVTAPARERSRKNPRSVMAGSRVVRSGRSSSTGDTRALLGRDPGRQRQAGRVRLSDGCRCSSMCDSCVALDRRPRTPLSYGGPASWPDARSRRGSWCRLVSRFVPPTRRYPQGLDRVQGGVDRGRAGLDPLGEAVPPGAPVVGLHVDRPRWAPASLRRVVGSSLHTMQRRIDDDETVGRTSAAATGDAFSTAASSHAKSNRGLDHSTRDAA
jgi:MoxR-like ATPase